MRVLEQRKDFSRSGISGIHSISVPLQIKCSKFSGRFGSFFIFVLEQSNIISESGNLGNCSIFVFWQHK